MTKRQEWAIERIRREAEKHLFHGKDKTAYEFKEFEARDYDSFVSLSFVVGMKGDEGTMAAVLCRDRCHFFIGKRGGITYPVSVKKGDRYKSVTRQFKSVYLTAYEQKYNK